MSKTGLQALVLMGLRLTKSHLSFLSSILFFFCASFAHATEVAFAGFAYVGQSQSVAAQFPYSKRFEATLGPDGVNALLRKNLASINPQGFTLIPRLDELAGRDQAIAVALVVTNETVSTEQFGQVYKVFAQIRGQALFFDFKSKTVLRAYPFSFAYLDALSAPPTDAQKDASISSIYLGKSGKPGILERFGQVLTQATLPTHTPKFVQITHVIVGDEAKKEFPSQYGPSVTETWVADTFGEAIAGKMGIPILPFAKGYAIGGVMAVSVGDSTVFNLTLPEPDYEFSVNLLKLKKAVFEETAAGKSLIYGTFATVKLEQPLAAKSYLDGQFKNGEVKVVSALQTDTDDFPAYQDSMRGLFTKLSSAIAGDSSPWIKSAAMSVNVDKQIISTRELLQSCK